MQHHPESIIFTENLDTLHEKTGVAVQRIDVDRVEKDFPPQILKTIDVIVCIGLSFDDRGFLGYYKKHNPSGIIIALCLEQPSYLGATDYYSEGDAQQMVPILCDQLIIQGS